MQGQRADGRGGGRTAKPRRRHLYLVLDDWSLGYSIRKIDLSSHSHPNDPHQLLAAGVRREGSVGEQLLPSAIFRVVAQRGLPMYFAGAFGTKIMAMHLGDDGDEADTHPVVPKRLVTAFDVRTRAMVFCPRPKQDRMSYPFYIPVGNRLLALSASFQLLNPPEPNHPTGQWCAPSWHELPEPPFDSRVVTSYAVHPDGQVIFVSIGKLIAPATFSFQMGEGNMEGRWEPLGDWILPFEGGAHYDAKLNAWVGISTYPDGIGHLSACDVIPGRQGQCLTWKVSKETFFSEDPEEKHVGATLVYMGHSSKFCLVECVCIEDKHLAGRVYNYREESPLPCRYLFRVSTFALKYDKNGDLTAGDSRRVRYYSVPGETTMLLLKYPVAFWM
ncbi:unnamed protein product [Urochloa decumbens]|uniref:Uncharacterized protein n=1 Tax=Urochloa decumbens TaxID=240449 RepID=A0ABC8YI65_9POAL